MKSQRLTTPLVALALAGWLAPLGLGLVLFWQATQADLPGATISSFPYREYAQVCFGIAIVWLLAAGVVSLLIWLLRRPRTPNRRFQQNATSE